MSFGCLENQHKRYRYCNSVFLALNQPTSAHPTLALNRHDSGCCKTGVGVRLATVLGDRQCSTRDLYRRSEECRLRIINATTHHRSNPVLNIPNFAPTTAPPPLGHIWQPSLRPQYRAEWVLAHWWVCSPCGPKAAAVAGCAALHQAATIN